MSEERTLALAGMFQSAALTAAIARGGDVDGQAARTGIESVFRIDADDVASVYGGGAGGLRLGLQTLVRQLEAPRDDIAVSRLAIQMMKLERKLAARPDLRDALAEGIESARRQLDHFGPGHATVQARLGELYEHTLSTLRPRIMVHGDPSILAQPAQAARIRAMLLAGVRSAVLWHQIGGRQWQLVLQRNRYVMLARGLLSRATLDHGA